jgi:hypothetical protein
MRKRKYNVRLLLGSNLKTLNNIEYVKWIGTIRGNNSIIFLFLAEDTGGKLRCILLKLYQSVSEI